MEKHKTIRVYSRYSQLPVFGEARMAEKVRFKCMRCGHQWEAEHDPDKERMCPKCRSNSVRVLKAGKESK